MLLTRTRQGLWPSGELFYTLQIVNTDTHSPVLAHELSSLFNPSAIVSFYLLVSDAQLREILAAFLCLYWGFILSSSTPCILL